MINYEEKAARKGSDGGVESVGKSSEEGLAVHRYITYTYVGVQTRAQFSKAL